MPRRRQSRYVAINAETEAILDELTQLEEEEAEDVLPFSDVEGECSLCLLPHKECDCGDNDPDNF